MLECCPSGGGGGGGRRVNEVDLVRKKDVAIIDHSVFSGFLGRN